MLGFAPALLGIEPGSSETRTLLHLLGLAITLNVSLSGVAPEQFVYTAYHRQAGRFASQLFKLIYIIQPFIMIVNSFFGG